MILEIPFLVAGWNFCMFLKKNSGFPEKFGGCFFLRFWGTRAHFDLNLSEEIFFGLVVSFFPDFRRKFW
jgi:hypothetical protein